MEMLSSCYAQMFTCSLEDIFLSFDSFLLDKGELYQLR